MKCLKLAALSAALFLGLAGSALATTWQSVQSGNYRVGRSDQASSTAVTGINSSSPAMTDVIYLSSTIAVNANVIRALQDGTVLSTQTVSLTGATPVSITLDVTPAI